MQAKLGALSNVEIEVHDEAWAKEKGMGCFLSVTAGTDEPAKMLEVRYNGGAPGAPTLAFVGKGVCFDSGGIRWVEQAELCSRASLCCPAVQHTSLCRIFVLTPCVASSPASA